MLYKRVLITGANGLLGQQLVRRMGRLPEYDVLATGLDQLPRFTGGSCGYARLDITNPGELQETFLNFAPDVVINCAAITQVDLCEEERDACWKINAEAVDSLARLCLSGGCQLVQVSTDFVFDGMAGPYRENARPAPLSYYGRSKLAGENYARGAGMDMWSIARTVLVYGAGERLSRSNFVLWLVDKLTRGEAVNIVTDQFRTPTFAPDLAAGIESIIRFDKHGVYHLSGREQVSIHEFALMIADVFNLDKSLIGKTDSQKLGQRAERPQNSGFIVLKAETELGFKPRPIRDALHELAIELGMKTTTP